MSLLRTSFNALDSEEFIIKAEKKVAEAKGAVIAIKPIADGLNETESSKQLERIATVLTSGKVQMGLVGLTNSGKSTTLNALMELDILPSSFQRQTVSSVCIKHSSSSSGELYGRKATDDDLALLASGVQAIRSFIANLNEHDRKDSIVYSELVLHTPFPCLSRTESIELEIYDTPGTSESSSRNVASAWNTALNDLAAIVLILSADRVFEVSQDALLEKIRSLHPYMMEKQNRLLVLINKYDMCFDGNQESWSPAQLKANVAIYLEVPTEQVVLFSAKSALEARKWKQNPSAVDEDKYGEVYYKLRRTPEKEAVASLKAFTPENVKKLAEVLESFSRIRDVESKLLWKLCVNGRQILLESAVDDSLREIAKLKSAVKEKIKAVGVEAKKVSVAQQEELIGKVKQQLENNCKRKIDESLPSLTLSAFEVQLSAIISTLENQLVSTASGRMARLQGQFDDKNRIIQLVLGVRNGMIQFGRDKVSQTWDAGINQMKVQLTAQLRQLLQELKQDIVTAQLTNHLNFESVDPGRLAERLSFPPVNQPAFEQFVGTNAAAMNALVLPRSVTRTRIEYRRETVGRDFWGNKKKKNLPHSVQYQATIFEANITDLSGAFEQLASFCATHVRSSLVAILRDQATKLSQILWSNLQELSKQPLSMLESELQAKKKELSLGDEKVTALETKSQELDQAESVLCKYM